MAKNLKENAFLPPPFFKDDVTVSQNKKRTKMLSKRWMVHGYHATILHLVVNQISVFSYGFRFNMLKGGSAFRLKDGHDVKL